MTKTGNLELNNTDTYRIYDITYPAAAEVATLLDPCDVIDFGEIDISGGQSWSAEKVLKIVDTGNEIRNLKAFSTMFRQGVDLTFQAIDTALAAAPSAAGVDASLTGEATGLVFTGQSVPYNVTLPNESARMHFQFESDLTLFGSTRPYDYAKDSLIIPSSIWLYYEKALDSETYIDNLDARHGRKQAELFKNRIGAQLFYINEDGYAICLGNLTDNSMVSMERTNEIVDIMFGYPAVTVNQTQVQVDYMLNGTFEIDEAAVNSMLQDYSLTYNSTYGAWVKSILDKPDLVQGHFAVVEQGVTDYIHMIDIPNGQVDITGTKEFGGENSGRDFTIKVLPNSSNTCGAPYTEWYSNGPAQLIILDTKYTVKTT